MNDSDTSHTSILLPQARVTLFSNDENSRNVFAALEQDWRFARVTLDVQDGDVEGAIEYYKTYESPDLIVIQTETIEDDLSTRLEALSGQCAEGTAAIVIGPVNDVDLYRKLVSMGVSDYLVKPLKEEVFANDIASTLIEKIGVSESRLIAFMGAKGGVGTTAIAEAMAWGVSDTLGQKTFLLDAAGGWSSLSVGMNFEPSTTMAEAVKAAEGSNEDSLTRMIHTASDTLSILSSGGDVMLDDSVDASGYEKLLDFLLVSNPVVLVDLSSASASLKRLVIHRANQIFLVTSPLLPSVRASRTLLQELKELRGGDDTNIDVLLNMQGIDTKYEVPKKQIEEGLGREIKITIPYNPSCFVKVESEAKKLHEDKTGKAYADLLLSAVRNVVAKKSTEGAKNASAGDAKEGLGKFLQKLTKKP